MLRILYYTTQILTYPLIHPPLFRDYPYKILLLSGTDGGLLGDIPLHIKMTVYDLGDWVQYALDELTSLPHRVYIATDLLVLWVMKLYTYPSRTGSKNIFSFLHPASLHLCGSSRRG